MPALSGESILTITDGTGAPLFVVYTFFDPATYALRDGTTATSNGTKTGALIVDNMTNGPQRVLATSADGKVTKKFSVPTNGAVLTAAQLASNVAANGGPITTTADLPNLQPALTLNAKH